jgi:hypothetical protein
MSRDPYSSRNIVDDRVNRIEDEVKNASTLLDVGKAVAAALCLLVCAVADVADACREDPSQRW